MTTLELLAFLEYLEKKGALSGLIEGDTYMEYVTEFLMQRNNDHWTDKFFPPTENK